jgi:hypothetical protein
MWGEKEGVGGIRVRELGEKIFKPFYILLYNYSNILSMYHHHLT